MDGNENMAKVPPSTIVPPDLKPALPPNVHLSLTIVYMTLYGLLFFLIYIQLWMILYYKHRRFSYQSVFLFLCLIWAGLRTTLFSFYFKNCLLANKLSIFPYWLLYCFPVCLQFVTLCLLVLFFAQVVFKAKAKYEPSKYKHALRAGLGLATAIFFVTNLICAIIVRKHQQDSISVPQYVPIVRVIINDTLFIICGVTLAILVYKLSRMSAANIVLEAKGTSKCQAFVACVLIVLLYSTRAFYNMIAVAKPLNNMLNFGLGWINVSDQAEFMNLQTGFAYISFGVVLFVWEFLPTFIVVVFFRVQRPHIGDEQVIDHLANDKNNPRAYFFDNPRRYDSDDDMSISRSLQSRGSFYEGSGAYSINVGSNIPSQLAAYSHGLPGTPPSMFTTTGSLPYNAGIEPSHYYDGT